MKKLFLTTIIVFVTVFTFTRCEKETLYKNDGINMIPIKLQKLYEDVPTYNYQNISLINSDILSFENAEHYITTLNHLISQYETWSNIFFNHYNFNSDDAIDSIIAETGFDIFLPISLFENKIGNYNNNLRYTNSCKEKKWLLTASTENICEDSIIISPIEQALFSKFHEVCIADTIYQLRENGISVLIPISEIPHISTIRNTPTPELINLIHRFPSIVILKSQDECYNAVHYKDGTQNHFEVGSRFFIWKYKFETAVYLHRAKVTTAMTNYRWIENKKKWDYAVCSLYHSTDTYSVRTDTTTCTPTAGPTANASQTPMRFHHRVTINYSPKYEHIDAGVVTTIGPFTFHKQKYIATMHMNPEQSSASFRHQGWTYSYNLLSGILM